MQIAYQVELIEWIFKSIWKPIILVSLKKWKKHMKINKKIESAVKVFASL